MSATTTCFADTTFKDSLMSPSVDYIPSLDKYYMWTVNVEDRSWTSQENFVERRESSDGITWSAPVPVTITQVYNHVWHVFVKYIPYRNEYWCVYAAYPDNTNSRYTTLYFARSADGLTWTTTDNKLISCGAGGSWDAGGIYRSAFTVNRNILNLWYTGYTAYNGVYKIGTSFL